MKLLNNYIQIKQVDNRPTNLGLSYYKKGYTELNEILYPNEAIVVNGNDLIDNGSTIHYFHLGLLEDDIIAYKDIFLVNHSKLLKKGCIVKRLEIEQRIGDLAHTVQDFFYITMSNGDYAQDNLVIVKEKTATAFYSNGEKLYYVSDDNVLLFITEDEFLPAKILSLIDKDSKLLYKEKLMDLTLIDKELILVKDIVGTTCS